MPADARQGKRTAPEVRGAALALLSFQALGIIYSDIGTSPLYTLNGIWPSTGPTPSSDDVIGGISAIIWALIILPLIKYVYITLYFGTGEGEGGTFALYQGLFPPPDEDHAVDRSLTIDYQEYKTREPVNTFKKRRISQALKFPLLVWCLFGTSLTMADGIFTPAVSVTSAVGGIAVAKQSVTNDTIPISIAFLVVLFLMQRFGTASISFLFAPIALLWFLALAATGIYNITFYPGIFRAFDPSRAVLLFVRTKNYDLLAGVLLALTGCEAVFANLGQFNAASIRISFSSIVFPSLVLAYLGQGARLIVDGDLVIQNVFYNSIPGPVNGAFYWIMFVLAILATFVASQALISATFSLFQQVINMKSFPSLRIICTSETHQGQVYIPVVNWALMILTIIIVATFSNLTNLSNAYGFAVATVMISTSILLSVSMYYVKQWHWSVAALYLVVFGFFDALFWGAAFKKVPAGAWVPLMIGVILSLAMLFWTWGKSLEDAFDGANRHNILHVIQGYDGLQTQALSIISQASEYDEKTLPERKELMRISTCAIFHKFSRGPGVPHTFVGFVRQWPSLPKVVVFMSVCIVPIARVPPDERYEVRKVRALKGIYGATYYLGFRDEFKIEEEILSQYIINAELEANPDSDEEWLQEIRRLVKSTTHVVPHYHVVSKPVLAGFMTPVFSFIRSVLIEDIYRIIAAMFPETGNWMTPADEIIHVGINATI